MTAPTKAERLKAVCQCCGKPIELGEAVVRVQYGTLGVTAHPHLRVTNRADQDDYFHRTCDVAVRAIEAEP